MNQAMSGAVLLLTIAAAGFYTNHPAAWWWVIATAMVAFLTEELRASANALQRHAVVLIGASIVTAGISWLTTLAAVYSLI